MSINEFARGIASSIGQFLSRSDGGDPQSGGVRGGASDDVKAAGQFSRQGPAFRGGGNACVALIGTDGRLISMSGPARLLFQRAGEAVNLSALFLPEERAGVDRAIRSKAVGVIEARARRGDVEAQSRQGDSAEEKDDIGVFELSFHRRPDGRANVLIVDRTAAKAELDAHIRNAEETARKAEEMTRKAEKASEDARAAAARLADLSHEMRTPLNAVIGFADTMRAETFGPLGHDKYDEYAEHIHASGAHLLDLVNAILDLAKIGADRYTLTRVKTDPGAIGKACAEMVRMSAEEAGLKLVTEIDDDLPESFLDPRALRQILLNLLSNAVKFTSDGEIRLSASAANGDIVFTVKDSGVGMSEEELEKLGARFTAAQGAGVRGAGGAGLGLALAFALAELHGGGLTIESAPGEGVTAIVRLPVIAPARPDREKTGFSSGGDKENGSSANGSPQPQGNEGGVLTQLERIEAYRQEVARGRDAAA